MSTGAPRLSVVVPAYRCAEALRETLPALLNNTLPREQWELIVVDDGSPDDTATVASQYADVVLRVANGPRGPAHARNMGALHARGDVLLFVDADVRVHTRVLERVTDRFAQSDVLTAMFGAYDEHPSATGLVSQYRNLLHRYVHLEHAGAATTFWAGCGAVRRAPFMAVGGFDAVHFPRPQIEDIELGYRLHDAGETLLLDPSIGGAHLKRWTLWTMLRTDVRDRAVPWMRLLLQRRSALAGGPLNTSRREQALVGCMALALPTSLTWLATGHGAWLFIAAACCSAIIAGNARLFRWFASVRGPAFAAATIPLRLLFYAASLTGASWALLSHVLPVSGSAPVRTLDGALVESMTGAPVETAKG